VTVGDLAAGAAAVDVTDVGWGRAVDWATVDSKGLRSMSPPLGGQKLLMGKAAQSDSHQAQPGRHDFPRLSPALLPPVFYSSVDTVVSPISSFCHCYRGRIACDVPQKLLTM